uniref:Uncharacterized protein n=1 Tax=Timema bartmani TaxID=61472 RepID=A0A7R9F6V6_9NEOP|nr:unnamed protein product [Timema bartmani]
MTHRLTVIHQGSHSPPVLSLFVSDGQFLTLQDLFLRPSLRYVRVVAVFSSLKAVFHTVVARRTQLGEHDFRSEDRRSRFLHDHLSSSKINTCLEEV